ncbi:RHS repeat domain-containing protein [Klebsiella spallanzanii]|uniref:RHS repeat domain-containing protein n=1 Tax=Klebsiella spallanzanii TaxID=2587528 RepID=UPI001118ADBA|nr:RHS repeat domain-containing protein [Klebsiella spallanzanii]
MRKKTKVIMVAFVAVACGAAFTLWKWSSCSQMQQAINRANVLIMMQAPALAGNPLIVYIAGNTNSYREMLDFSRCGLLEKQVVTSYSGIGAVSIKTKTTLTRQRLGKEKGWIQESVAEGSHGTRIISDSYFYTDDLGRIAWMKEKKTVNGKTREQNTWRYHYDDAHRLLRETLDGDETAQNYTTEFHYDENGRLIGTSAMHRTQTLRWDKHGRWLSTEVVRENAKVKSMRQDVCSAWDRVGNCTINEIVETESSLKGDIAEKRRMRSDTQIHYQN